MKNKPFSAEELEQLAKLEAMSDDDIDTDDIPEAPQENRALARRGVGFRPPAPVTVRLDADVAHWFETHAGTGALDAEVNRVLRRHAAAAEKRRD